MSGFANYSFYLPDGCPQVCGQHRPWLPLPLACGHILQLWPLPEGGILPVVAREMSCPPGQGPFLGSLGPTQGAYSTCKAPPREHLAPGALSQTPFLCGPWLLGGVCGDSQSLELASVCCSSSPGTPARKSGSVSSPRERDLEILSLDLPGPTQGRDLPRT